MSNNVETPPFSNPFAMGVTGLAIACFALGPVYCGFAGKDVVAFVPWAMMFGGFAQLIGGIIDYRNKAVLGGTALSMYGFLWICLGIEVLMSVGFGWKVSPIIGGNVDIMLLIMSLGFTYGFASTNFITFFILVEIDLAFLSLALLKLGVVGASAKFPIGVLIYVIGITAIYAATAFLLNTHYGRKVLPMGGPLIKK